MSDGGREVERIVDALADDVLVLSMGTFVPHRLPVAMMGRIAALRAALTPPPAEGAWRDGVEAVAQLADKYAAAYRDSPLAATTARRIAEDARALAPRPSPAPTPERGEGKGA